MDKNELTQDLLEEIRFRQEMQGRRAERGWSQGELARRMNDEGWTDFHQTTVSRIEKGQRPIRLGEARAIARLLDTEVGHMIAPSEESHLLERFWGLYNEIQEDRETAIRSMRVYEESRASMRGVLRNMDNVDVTKILDDQRITTLKSARRSIEQRLRENVEELAVFAMETAFGGPPEERNEEDEND